MKIKIELQICRDFGSSQSAIYGKNFLWRKLKNRFRSVMSRCTMADKKRKVWDRLDKKKRNKDTLKTCRIQKMFLKEKRKRYKSKVRDVYCRWQKLRSKKSEVNARSQNVGCQWVRSHNVRSLFVRSQCQVPQCLSMSGIRVWDVRASWVRKFWDGRWRVVGFSWNGGKTSSTFFI